MKLKHFWLAVGLCLFLNATLPVGAQVFTVQHNFTNTPDGANPRLVAWTNGLFYGSTANGGTNGSGSLFTFNTNGSVLTTIYNFTNAPYSGVQPNNLLLTGSKIYGTAKSGGTNSYGMIFSVNLDGTGFTPLYSFARSPDGNYPVAGPILIGTTLYGTTQLGGTNWGTVFSINTDGSGYTTLHDFTNSPDAEQPFGELASSGNTLYGITTYGGTNGYGTIYSINTSGGAYTILRSFTNVPDGSFPSGGLIVNAGILYGTTAHGGSNNAGTVFAINTSGSGYTILHHFTSALTNTDGAYPKQSLTFNNGLLYGTASSGGTNGGGTVFQLNPNGTGFAVIKSFTNSSTAPNDLESGVTLLGNTIWGTTYLGGSGTYGTLFSLLLSPMITTQPQSVTVTNGNPASFSVGATDGSVTNYQWYFNTNTLLAGQTSNTLNFASAATNNTGTYTVVVSDNFGSVTSGPAVLTVLFKPVVTTQPQSLTVTNGNPATFTVGAIGSGVLNYQWYFNTNTLLAGQTSNSLNFASTTTNNAGAYTVVVTNNLGSVTSSPAILTVNSLFPPSITNQPHNLTVTNGNPATFTVGATGSGVLNYQWYFNTNTLLAGQSSNTLNFASVTNNNAGTYTVVVSNSVGSVTSSPAVLTILFKPTITTQPLNISATNGYSASFTNIASGTAPLYYQWYFNTNTPVTGGTNSILRLSFVATNQAGYYTVIVSNVVGNATSSPAKLTVVSTAPIIFVQPQPLTVTNGGPVNFSVTAAGASPLLYQWYTNTVLPPNLLAGKTNSTLSYASASTSLAANYLVIISNSMGKTTSSLALLTVITKPVITLQPQSVTVTNGNPVTFTAAASGPGLLGYQWLFRTNTFIAGATNTTLIFTNAITNLVGVYSMKVTNSFGSVTSSFALLTISNRPNLLSSAFNPASGSFSLAFANTANSTNRLWASTNLAAAVAWQAIATNVMATNGLWFFTDTNIARTNNMRFYRFSNP